MSDLTPRQQEVLKIVEQHLAEHGYPPSLREIASRLGTTGTLNIARHLDALEEKGYLRRNSGSRAITLMSRPDPTTMVPIVGQVRAGSPTLATENIEGYRPVDRNLVQGKEFFLRVRGNSMIEDHILEGDLVRIRQQETANNGEIVVAMVGDEEATLKRFYREKGKIRLQPANSTMAPIIVTNGTPIRIIGRCVGLERELE
jgi:repressor LexA